MSTKKPVIADVLAQRYASTRMCEIWSSEGRILQERELWIAVMKAQRELGIDIPQAAIDSYERVKLDIRLGRIAEREKKLRHDVKSRIEEFCELAGAEQIHKGMTSRDLTDNVEQCLVLHSLRLVEQKTLAVLHHLAVWAEKTKSQIIVARTHNVPAQPSTLGKRLAMFGEEILQAYLALGRLIENYPLRGIQGAVGTQLDQWTLLNGNVESVQKLEAAVYRHLGFQKSLTNVGQVYPRSLDFMVVSALFQISAGASNLTKTLRLMTGLELANEGFQEGQVGSSAMPHKMNARNCERVNGFHTILNGYLNMTMGLSGDQWNEGDVSCSVVRRVVLPASFFVIDGVLETLLTILQEMGFYDAMIAAEVERLMPFLATTTLMMAAVKKGQGREQLHEAIKEHAIAAAAQLRQGIVKENPLPAALANDPRIPLSLSEIQDLLVDPTEFLGSAVKQTEFFVSTIAQLVATHPEAAKIKPEEVL